MKKIIAELENQHELNEDRKKENEQLRALLKRMGEEKDSKGENSSKELHKEMEVLFHELDRYKAEIADMKIENEHL